MVEWIRNVEKKFYAKHIFDILIKYEALTQSEKILPPLTELELETEQNDPTVCISFSSFLDETNCSVPDLEELPNPYG